MDGTARCPRCGQPTPLSTLIRQVDIPLGQVERRLFDLLVDAPRSVDELAELTWPDAYRPVDANQAVRNGITRLRRKLARHGYEIRTVGAFRKRGSKYALIGPVEDGSAP